MTSVGSNPETHAASWQAASQGLDQGFSVASTTAEQRLKELRTARRQAERELVADHLTSGDLHSSPSNPAIQARVRRGLAQPAAAVLWLGGRTARPLLLRPALGTLRLSSCLRSCKELKADRRVGMGQLCATSDLQAMAPLSWWYNWGLDINDAFQNTSIPNEFVPMVWGPSKLSELHRWTPHSSSTRLLG